MSAAVRNKLLLRGEHSDGTVSIVRLPTNAECRLHE